MSNGKWQRRKLAGNKIERAELDENNGVEFIDPDGNAIVFRWDPDFKGLLIRCTNGALNVRPYASNTIFINGKAHE